MKKFVIAIGFIGVFYAFTNPTNQSEKISPISMPIFDTLALRIDKVETDSVDKVSLLETEEKKTEINETTSINSIRSKTSWYGGKFHGRKTANGDVYDMNKLTCAAINGIKFGTKLKVTNLANGKSVIVTVNDRGAFKKYGRDLDLSRAAFSQIADTQTGVINITYEILKD